MAPERRIEQKSTTNTLTGTSSCPTRF